MASQDADEPAAARTIGRYQILEALESGGMGMVYRAFDPRLQTQVCIKQIKEGPGSIDFQKRWLPEVRAIAQLRHHPNIVTIYDASEAEFGGRPTIVMEFIEGKTLQKIIRGREPIGLSSRLRLMEQLAAGLAFAHSKRIVHRDIKPANLMVDRAGVLKILDFGIARVSGGTTASAVIGTMNYMSPEQWGKDPVDARSDIFSAGAVFYEILGGQRAFPGDTVAEVYPQILNGRPTPLEELCPDLDGDIVRIVNRMLEKRPADRYPTLEPVQHEIERARARLTPAAEEQFTRTARWQHLADAAATPTPGPPGRPVIDRESVARRRAVKIDSAVRAAQQAFATSAYDDVLVASGQVLELDPDHAIALDLLERARAALHERDARQLMSGAREHAARGDYSKAMQSIEAALALAPHDAELVALGRQIASAKAEADHGRARLAAIQETMGLVHAAVDAGQLDEAAQHIAAVLRLEPGHAEALRLGSLVTRLVDERARKPRPSVRATDDTHVVKAFDQLRQQAPTATPAPAPTPAPASARAPHRVAPVVPAAPAWEDRASPLLRFWRPIAGALAVIAVVTVAWGLVRNSQAVVEPEQSPTPQTSPVAAPLSIPSPAPATPAASPDEKNAKEPASTPNTPVDRQRADASTDKAPASKPAPGVPKSQASERSQTRAGPPAKDGALNDPNVAARLDANRLLRQAQENLDLGDWDTATSNAEKARQLDPANPGLPKMMQDIETLKRLEQGRRKGGGNR